MNVMYKVIADYRPNNPNKPTYYVLAESARDAKKGFENDYPWLKVYDITLVEKDEAEAVASDPYKSRLIIGNYIKAKHNIPRLSGDYIRGYTKAIQDIIEIFDYIQSDLRSHHKTLNAKTSKKLLECCLKNRERIRENFDGFIRYNKQKDDFEFFRRID